MFITLATGGGETTGMIVLLYQIDLLRTTQRVKRQPARLNTGGSLV